MIIDIEILAVISIQTGFQEERLTLTFMYMMYLFICANFSIKFGEIKHLN